MLNAVKYGVIGTVLAVGTSLSAPASPVLEVSKGGKGQNAEVEQAVRYPYGYEAWIGCGAPSTSRT